MMIILSIILFIWGIAFLAYNIYAWWDWHFR
jgi:hypothetical protein